MTYDSSTVSDTNGDASIRQRSRFTAEDENFLGTTGELKTERRTSAKPLGLTFLHSCCATPSHWKGSNLFQDKDLTASTLPDTSPGSCILHPESSKSQAGHPRNPQPYPKAEVNPSAQISNPFSLLRPRANPKLAGRYRNTEVGGDCLHSTQRVPSSPQEPKLR